MYTQKHFITGKGRKGNCLKSLEINKLKQSGLLFDDQLDSVRLIKPD